MSESQLFSRVLLVEDDSSHALLIKRALKGFVDNVHHCERVSDAMDLIGQANPDLIVTDLNLPDATGIAHVATFQNERPDTPIIVLTSSTSLIDAVEAMKQGARDFIVKNFGPDFSEILGLSLSRVYTAQKLEDERRALQREMSILRVAIENSADGLAVVDRRGRIGWANGACLRFLSRCGGHRDDLLSVSPESFQKGAELLDTLAEHLRDLPGGAVWQTEVLFSEEKDRAYELSLSPIAQAEGDGSTTDCVVWIRDISEQKRREKFQREILSTTTHDLKGPLGAIITGSELLTGMLKEGSKEREIVIRISSAAHGILHMIDEFLSARRIKEGNYILRPELYRLGELVQEVRENYQTIAVARRIALEFDVRDPDVRACVDRLGFTRVLGNLLSNALKFTPSGGRVRVQAAVSDGELRVEVSDTGAGMDASETQQIFERFSRLRQHEGVSGSGLGLFVVKSIVAAHSGSIEVKSSLGQGTSFTLTFPGRPPVNDRGEIISLEFA